MLNNFWFIVFMCSTGWILIILGNILKVHVFVQLLMLIVGLLLSVVSVILITKWLLGGKKG